MIYSNIIFTGAFIIGICCVWAWRSISEATKDIDKDDEPNIHQEPKEASFEELEMQINHLLGKYAILANQMQVNGLIEDLGKFIRTREEEAYTAGLHQVPVGDLKYTREEVISFAQKMISQYKFGNQNIEQRKSLEESLPKK